MNMTTTKKPIGVKELRRRLPKLKQPRNYVPKWASVAMAAAHFDCTRYVLYHAIAAGDCRTTRGRIEDGFQHNIILVDIGGEKKGQTVLPLAKAKVAADGDPLQCRCCKGHGTIPCKGGDGEKTCPVCNGAGLVPETAGFPVLAADAKWHENTRTGAYAASGKSWSPPKEAKGYLSLLLTGWELEKLTEIAEDNCRDPEQQARWILKQALHKKVGAE